MFKAWKPLASQAKFVAEAANIDSPADQLASGIL